MAAPTIAPAPEHRAIISLIFPLRKKRTAAMAAPEPATTLFVPTVRCTGTPAIIYAGMVISPPPPAMLSTKPPKKISGQTIKHVFSNSFMSSSPCFAFQAIIPPEAKKS